MYKHMMDLRQKPETSRTGLSWTDTELENLVEEAAAGFSMSDIAIAHKRTVKGVKCRLLLKALEIMNDEDKTMEEVSKQLNLPMIDIEQFIKSNQDARIAKLVETKVDPTTKQLYLLAEILEAVRGMSKKLDVLITASKEKN